MFLNHVTELLEIELFICIRMDLALNNLQRLICHKNPTNQPTNAVLLQGFLCH